MSIKPGTLDPRVMTLTGVRREGKHFAAVDLLSDVADREGLKKVAEKNLIKGREEHYRLPA